MATLAPPRNLTTAYNRGLAIATGQASRAVRRRMAGIAAKSIAGDWPTISKRIAADIVGSQQSAALLSAWYLQESVRARLHVPATLDEAPLAIGRTASGMTIARYVDRTPDIVAARIADGMKPDIALAMSERRLVGMAITEPNRIGREAIAWTSINDDNFSGWERVAEAGACDFCEMLATRGDAYTSQSSAQSTSTDLAYHNNCRCSAEPVLAANAPALNAAGAQAWADAEDRPEIYRTGTRSAGKSRGTSSTARAFPKPELFRPGAQTPERLGTVQLQITQIEQRMAQLEARRQAGDLAMAEPIKWNNGRLAELRSELARLS